MFYKLIAYGLKIWGDFLRGHVRDILLFIRSVRFEG